MLLVNHQTYGIKLTKFTYPCIRKIRKDISVSFIVSEEVYNNFSAYMDTIERIMKLLSKHFADNSEPAFN